MINLALKSEGHSLHVLYDLLSSFFFNSVTGIKFSRPGHKLPDAQRQKSHHKGQVQYTDDIYYETWNVLHKVHACKVFPIYLVVLWLF